ASSEQTREAGELYARINAGQLSGYRLQRGSLVPLGARALLAKLAFWRTRSVGARVGLLAGSAVSGFLLLGGLAMYGADVQPGSAPWLMPTTIGVTVLGTLWLAALSVGLEIGRAHV